MAIQKTEAIILRRQEIRETSLILSAFTRDLGKVQGLAKGVRGARATVPWYLEPLTLQFMALYERRRSPWVLVSACDLLYPFDLIRRDLTRMAYAAVCLELVDRMTENLDPHPEIFQLLLHTLKAIEESVDPRSVTRFFEVHLLKASGLLPDLQNLSLSPGGQLSMEQILQTPLDRISRLRLSVGVEEELHRLLNRFFQSVLDRELKSQNFLQAIGLENESKSPVNEVYLPT